MKTPFVRLASVFALVLVFALAACGSQSTPNATSDGQTTVHLGYFPNLTHAVGIVGYERGTFQQALGSNVKLVATTFNAGPAEIEALNAGSIDIAYVGPSPAINGYVKSQGADLRVIAGASSGGVLFIVRPTAHIKTAKDLANKKIADPQQGGTQDIALRYYLQQNNLKAADKGGNVQIVPTDNPTILTLFKAGQIDGAWVPEPWATRLVVEGKGKVFLDERSLWPDGKFVTTNVVVRKAFMDQHPEIVNKFLQAHVDTVQWILSNPDSAKTIVNSEIKRITGKGMPASELDIAWNNLDITYDPLTSSLYQSADRAFSLGFLGSSKPALTGIYNLGLLNTVLTSKGLATVQGA
ncbi:MAG TPA: ABC transporter substrate-binding protein [Ktedonobacteraceae bacterium]|nr:ABC transporter substrate-binding protein [Ktedonobacteraceae bacterium]